VLLDYAVNGTRLDLWQGLGGLVLIGSILRISTMKGSSG
jgi:hypothetical protein